MNYLDKTGLTYLWSKVEDKLSEKADITYVDTKITEAITTALNTEV